MDFHKGSYIYLDEKNQNENGLCKIGIFCFSFYFPQNLDFISLMG